MHRVRLTRYITGLTTVVGLTLTLKFLRRADIPTAAIQQVRLQRKTHARVGFLSGARSFRQIVLVS